MPEGNPQPAAFFWTCAPQVIVLRLVRRCNGEVTYEESRWPLGVETEPPGVESGPCPHHPGVLRALLPGVCLMAYHLIQGASLVPAHGGLV